MEGPLNIPVRTASLPIFSGVIERMAVESSRTATHSPLAQTRTHVTLPTRRGVVAPGILFARTWIMSRTWGSPPVRFRFVFRPRVHSVSKCYGLRRVLSLRYVSSPARLPPDALLLRVPSISIHTGDDGHAHQPHIPSGSLLCSMPYFLPPTHPLAYICVSTWLICAP